MFAENLQSTVIKIGQDIKALRTKQGDLSSLTTTQKANLVAAINELKSALNSIDTSSVINDSSNSSTSQTYSINKIKEVVQAAITALVDGAPTALDTLNELATSLQNKESAINALTTGLDDRVSYKAQTKQPAEKTIARNNIDAVGKADNIQASKIVSSTNRTNLGITGNHTQEQFNAKVDEKIGVLNGLGNTNIDYLAKYNEAAGNS